MPFLTFCLIRSTFTCAFVQLFVFLCLRLNLKPQANSCFCLARSNIFFSALVWKWDPAAWVGQAREWARRGGETEEAAAPGAAGLGDGHRSQQGWHLIRHYPQQLFVPFTLTYSPPCAGSLHQQWHWPYMTRSPWYQSSPSYDWTHVKWLQIHQQITDHFS